MPPKVMGPEQGRNIAAWQVWADNKGITHRLKIPWQHADFVITQLRSLVPGIRVEPDPKPPRRRWTTAVEVGLTHSARPLRIYSAADVATSLLASMQALQEGETVLMQWVITPAVPQHPPIYQQAHSDTFHVKSMVNGTLANRDEVKERRDKLAEPNVMAVLRVAGLADAPARAVHLVSQVRQALSATRRPSTRFYKRLVSKAEVQRRIDRASGCVNFPIQLSAPELAAVAGWPIGNPAIAGLAKPLGRQFPVIGAVAAEGIIIGNATFPGQQRPVAIGFAEALMHVHCLGKTGTGKSVLLGHIAEQIMAARDGLIVMETEGNLFRSVLDCVPPERVNDVVLLDLSDGQFPVGFNILDQGHPATVIDEIMDLFQYKFGRDSMGIWSQEYIYHGLRTIAENPELTFIDIMPLLNPMTQEEVKWADNISRQVRDDELRRWWQRHDKRGSLEQQKRADPVLSRVWQLSSRPELRYIVGQSRSTFQMRDILERNQILLINLKGVSGDTASLMGTLLMNAIWHATKTTYKERPSYLLLDEFADFMDLPIDTESMLAQARKHRLGMVLANQHMGQLKPAVRDAVMNNTRSKIFFEADPADGIELSRHLSGEITAHDITSLRTHEAIASVLTPIGPSGPISIASRPPVPPTGTSRTVIERSRERYGLPVGEVRKAIQARYEPKLITSRRPPPISDWD